MNGRKDLQFMKLCKDMSSIFATCGKRQYACLLVDELGHIVGSGYNGGPKGTKHCDEGGCPRFANQTPSGSNYDDCIAIHAEQNAFLHSDYSAKPVKLYVNGPPCFTCAKLIANSTVKDVYYIEDLNYANWKTVNQFLLDCGVSTWKVDNASL
jgi:dCMP deaminase